MRIQHFIGVATACILAGALVVDAHAACEPFTAFTENDETERYFSDLDDSGGVSTGDKRLIGLVLLDAAGAQIGERYMSVTVLETNADGSAGPIRVDSISILEDGVILDSSVDTQTLVRSVDNTDRPPRNPSDVRIWPVVGGMGAYTGATGTVTSTVSEDGGSEIVFTLACE